MIEVNGKDRTRKSLRSTALSSIFWSRETLKAELREGSFLRQVCRPDQSTQCPPSQRG